MSPAPYRAEPGNWFLRGVQSAAFYYLSCSPWLEYKHQRKRKREARDQAQDTTEIVTTQPGLRQPGPFQTNAAWAEELMLGPGPPKGWKKDTLLQKLQKKVHKEQPEPDTTPSSLGLPASYLEPTDDSLTRPSTQCTNLVTDSSTRPSLTINEREEQNPSNDIPTPNQAKPPLERRLSNAMENFKDSLRTTLHPPKWNWKRYDREDEILAGFTERVTRMWNRATAGIHHEDSVDQGDRGEPSSYRRKRAGTNESERYDYSRARYTELNDMHPPVVSQLPATRAEAAWMLLPPPSVAVMEARTRPAAEPEMRWPLCVIGRPQKEPKLSLAKTLSTDQIDSQDFVSSSDAEAEQETQSLKSNDGHSEVESVHSSDIRSENQRPSPSRIKHLSDPIIRPPAIHAASRIAGDLLVPKRRDSWQFHYLVPLNQQIQWTT